MDSELGYGGSARALKFSFYVRERKECELIEMWLECECVWWLQLMNEPPVMEPPVAGRHRLWDPRRVSAPALVLCISDRSDICITHSDVTSFRFVTCAI